MRSVLGTKVLAGLAGAVLASALLAGCGGDDADDSSGPGATPTASGSPSAATGKPTPTDPASGVPGEGTGVEPASGKFLTVGLARMRGPRGWFYSTDLDFMQSARDRDRPVYVSLTQSVDTYGEAFGPMTPDELAQNSISVRPEPDKVKVLDHVVLDGVEFYHISGPDGSTWCEQLGVSHEGMDVTIRFEFPLGAKPRVREELMAAVLPTFEWL